MSNLKDFVIENGVLTKYKGKGGEVVIPEGVIKIGAGVFSHLKNLTSVVIPNTVIAIGSYAFNNCEALTSVVIPNSVTTIGYDVFGFTKKLEFIIIPKSVVEIGTDVFWGSGIKKIVVENPKLLLTQKNIGDYMDPVVEFPNICFATKEKLSPLAVIKTAEDYAYVLFFQTSKDWERVLNRTVVNANEAVQCFVKIILSEEKIAMSQWKKVLSFIESNAHTLSRSVLEGFLECVSQKYKKIEAMFLASPLIQKVLSEKAAASQHPIEEFVEKNLNPSTAYSKALQTIKNGIEYLDSNEICDVKILAFIVSEYMKFCMPEKGGRFVVEGYKTDCRVYKKVPIADEVASALNQEQLQEALMALAFEQERAFVLPFARYADENHAAMLVTQMKKWDNWGTYARIGRENIIIARSGLLLNDTKAAMLHIDSVGKLDVYAKMRNTDADTLRDTVLSDFGFDEKGKIYYDLKATVVSANLSRDLTVYLIDENTGKEVKSLPKKNVETDIYEAAKTELSNLKKNLKKVYVNRKNKIFECFMNGKTQEVKAWKEVYLKNPVFTAFACLIVWKQNEKSFILADNGVVDCSGKEYLITDDPISVAHPIEMTAEEIIAWQNYFSSNGLKQPFEQIWEPAYKDENIHVDRYKGCEISAYKLQKKEIHGISTFGMSDYSEEYGFKLTDCKMKYTQSQDRFMFGQEARLILGAFSFKKLTRYVNHIIYFFDKLTILDKIAEDDTSIEGALGGFTVAQILGFIDFATENKSVNVAAILLNYKNEHFGDTMDEFILEL